MSIERHKRRCCTDRFHRLRSTAATMLRKSLSSLFPVCNGIANRSISASLSVLQDAEDTVDKEAFLKSWDQHAPATLKQPNFSSDWTQTETKEEETKATEIPKKLKLNFYMPSKILMEGKEVDMALLPAVTGDFGVMPGHVPTMAQLRPGVVSVHSELDKEIKKYFVSGGFAFIHADSSTDVCAIEAVELEELDKEAVKAGLAEYTAKLGSIQGSGDDYEIAAAQIGVDVYSAMDAALS